MKKFYGFIIAAAIVAVSCGGNKTAPAGHDDSDSTAVLDSTNMETAPKSLDTASCKSEKSDMYCEVKAAVEWPKGDDSVSASIRWDLLKEMDRCMAFEGEGRKIAMYRKSPLDMKQATEYYVSNAFKQLRAQSEKDHKMRVETEREFSAREGRKFEAPDVNQYSKTLEIKKVTETDRYSVYGMQLYCYYGGAHGSTVGMQYTYSRANGKRFSQFLKSGVVNALQPLMRQGLIKYFMGQDADVNQSTLADFLQIDGDVIPLPSAPLYPSADGIVFTYGQYEIAPYAAGRPSFSIPYGKIKPYLTKEAIALLGL